MTRRPAALAIPISVLALLGACAGTPKGPQAPVFYPGPPVEPRLQLLGRYTGTEDIARTSSFRKFVVGKVEQEFIARAHGVAWWNKRLYVCDPGRPGVAVFDFRKKTMQPLGGARGMFKKPIEIDVAPDGWKYISDAGHRKVLVYDKNDEYKGAFGDPDTWKPIGVAATDELLYVTDVANHQVVVLDRRSGAEKRRIGDGKSGAPGKFFYPLSVRVGPGGDLWVSDSFNFRVQHLKPDGTFVGSVGSVGDRPGNLARPRGIALDREGRLYVVDAAFENVQIFDSDGKLLLFFGGPGSEPGNLNLPASVTISYDAVPEFRDRVAKGYGIEHVLFVTSQTGPNKVNVYGLLRKPTE